MTKAILDALGVDDEVSALRAIGEFTQFLNGVFEATGKAKSGEALVAVRQNASVSKQIGELTGKPLAEAPGIVMAWKSAFEQHPELQAQLAEAKSQVEARDRAELIKRGRDERKLTPASAGYWETRPVAELKAFLDVAPVVIPDMLREPRANGEGDPTGKNYEDLSPMEKHELLEAVGQEQFDAIREDSRKRLAATTR